MTMEIVGNDAQFNEKVTLLKDLEIYGNIKNKTKDTSFNFSDNFIVKIQGNEKLRIISESTTFTDSVTAPSGIFSGIITATNVSVAQSVTANEYYGTFKGSIDPSVADDKISEGNSSAEVVDTGSNGHFKVLTEGTERFRILSDGDVGIGTTNPFGTLEVQKNGVPAIISNYNNSKHVQIDVGNDGGGFQVSTGNHFAINHQPYADRGTNNNLTERLRITSGGDLRLGLNSVAQQTDSAHYIMTLTGKSGQTGAGAIAFKDPSANTDGFIFADSGNLFITADYDSATADSSIRFRVDGSSEKLRIASAGQIGIGGANYGTTGQVLTSQGSGSAVQWKSVAAKAFVNFDGTTNTGGNCSIRDSHNVSSVTDNGTGHYTIIFSTAFANTNYTVTFGHSNANNNGSTHGVIYTEGIATGSLEIINFNPNNSTDRVDKVMISVVIHAT